MKSRGHRAIAFLGSFALTIAAILTFVETTPPIEISRAKPVLAADANDGATATLAGPPAQRTTIALDEGDVATQDVTTFDRARFEAALAAARDTPPNRRKRWLSSKESFMGSKLINGLLAAGDGPEGVACAIDFLKSEEDPLLQAVLLQYLGLCEDDPRVLLPLENAVRGVLVDRTRPVIAELAVDSLLAAMGRQDKPVGALIHQIAANTKDEVILRDLWFGFVDHGFDFATNREVLMEGLTNESAGARFGASESLRMFALAGELTPEEFVAAFEPCVLAEHDADNQLLFLETLGAVGKDAAFPTLRRLAADATSDPSVRTYAATVFAAHADPKEALEFCRKTFTDASDPANRRLAITALGALAAPEAADALAEIYSKSKDPATRRLALLSLTNKSGASIDTFLDAAVSDDAEARALASEQFLAPDRDSLSPEQDARIREWQLERARTDTDPNVRSNAVIGAFAAADSESLAVVEERMVHDSAPEVRGTAASLLYLSSWARGDANGCARIRAAIDAENVLVRSRMLVAFEQLDALTPDDAREMLEQQKRVSDYVSSVCPVVPGGKDVFGMQSRMFDLMLAQLGP